MARRKAADNKVAVGNVTGVSGEVNIAAGDIYKGYTAQQVSVLLTQITSTFQPKPFDGRCPYKGLDVFEEEDAELFFGRERLVKDLVSRVKESRTVFITGPSGSGKSSVVRAGLIHALKQGVIKNSDRWLYESIKPGREPLKDLALAFSRLKSPDLADYFQAHANENDILNKCAESVLSGHKDQHFVLFIDQFEEVFTQINQEEERVAFINMLAHAGTVENGRVIILFAMRSDFVSNCATYPALNELLSQEFRQIGAMQPEELVSAIALPARHVGLPIEDELIARIINDMKGEPGALPLMQFALKDLFDSQQAKGGVIALTLQDYLKHGGIHKSLERHADKSFAQLSESEQQLARSIFSGLIEIGRGTQDTRRTALFDELIPANTKPENVEVIVQKLADARLITTDEQAGKDTVTISHEKLIDAWPWLKKLVNENRDAIALQNEIAADAKEWDDHKRDESYLYTGARLASAREQLESKKILLGGLALKFVDSSIEAVEAAQQREERRRQRELDDARRLAETETKRAEEQARSAANLRKRSIYLSVALVAALAAVGAAAFSAFESRLQSRIALARQLAAQAQSINTTRNSRQMIAVLLATESLQIFPSGEAAQMLLNSNDAAHPVARMTHDGWVNSVAFSPDGKMVVSGSYDGTTRVWDAATGEELARMTHDDLVNSVAFSPDGKMVVSGSRDGTARVWEAATGEELARMTYDAWVNSAAFSPDGKMVVSGSSDYSARVWESATGEELARMTHNSDVNFVAFSLDGKYVVSGSADGTVLVWQAATGEELARMTHDSSVYSVAFSPDGKMVVSGSSDFTARVWEAATGEELARMTYDSAVNSVAFSPDSKTVVLGSADGTARVWGASTGVELARMTHDSWVHSVAFSLDGKYVVSGSEDGTARVWEAATGVELARMTHDGVVYSVAFSPDGQTVVSGSEDGTARVWEAATGEELAQMTHDGWVHSVAFSPNGKMVVSGSVDGTVLVWQVATGEELAHMSHDAWVKSIVFSPDGKMVVSGSNDGTARVWEVASGEELARMSHDHDAPVSSVAFSPDGKKVVSGSGDGTARVWEAVTGEELARMTHDSSVNSIAFSPDGKTVVSGSGDGTARVWEAVTGIELARMTHGESVFSVAFSPDGKHVVSRSSDYTARVWEIASGEELAQMTHAGVVYSVAFSPDGKYVVSSSEDGTARVWEAATGVELASMTHDSAASSVAFSLDGKMVVSGSIDGTVRVWLWQTEDLISTACAYLPRNLTQAEWQQYIGDALPYQAVCPNLPIEPEIVPTTSGPMP